jgi:hypothetical protein
LASGHGKIKLNTKNNGKDINMVMKVKKDEVTMDVVRSLALELSDVVDNKVVLSQEEQENLYDSITCILEDYFDYPDYTNYN